jgi:hypothetical protein
VKCIYKTDLACSQTHNEQTLMFLFGIMLTHASFYIAKAVSNVLVCLYYTLQFSILNHILQMFIKKIMSIPGVWKPDHIIYDSCCLIRQQAQGYPWFADIGMCVDPWHLKTKHKMHEHCRINCNPKNYPKLLTDDGKWFFNTSIAEQLNVWLGGFHSIFREMLPVKYNFFLNKMICLWNVIIIDHLHETGQEPHHWTE